MDQEFMREIANDRETPKNKKKLNEDGFFESEEDCSDPNHVFKCGEKRITLNEF